MKRILNVVAIVLMLLTVLSITACSSKPTDGESISEQETNTDFSLQVTEASTTAVQKEKYIIIKSNGFTDSGVAWVECCDEMGYPYLALINTDGEILYKHDNGGSIESYEDVESGMGMIDDGQYKFINEKGETIKTFEKSEFTEVLAVGGGQALLYKKEDGINGFKHSIAVLGNDGNWTLDFQEVKVYEDNTLSAYYAGCNMFGVCTYYDWIMLNGNTGTKTHIANIKNVPYYFNGKAYIDNVTVSLYSYVSIFNSEDRSDALVLENTCAILDIDGNYKATDFTLRHLSVNGFLTGDSYCVAESNNRWRFANCETGEGALIENYEIYRVKSIIDIGENYLAEILGKDQNMYFTVFDINGKELFDPIKYDSVFERAEFIIYSAPDEDGLIAIDYNGKEIRRFNYDSIGTFNCGLAVAEKSTESGDTLVVFINSEGEEIISALYE